jgi:hypothetical protein
MEKAVVWGLSYSINECLWCLKVLLISGIILLSNFCYGANHLAENVSMVGTE